MAPPRRPVAYFRTLLRQRSHKVTPARLALLSLLEKIHRPLTVETIMRRLAPHRFDQATIYRTLALLKHSGLVRQVDFHQGHAWYELAGQSEHHHAICTGCGRLEDITDCCADSLDTIALQQSGFAQIKTHALEFFGVCKNCMAKRR